MHWWTLINTHFSVIILHYLLGTVAKFCLLVESSQVESTLKKKKMINLNSL